MEDTVRTRTGDRLMVNMMVANYTIRLGEILNHIIADNTIFNNSHQVSLSTLGRVLQRNRSQMKQVYRVPFELREG